MNRVQTLAILLVTQSAVATDTATTSLGRSAAVNIGSVNTTTKAQQWSLTDNEWTDYQHLMQGPRGIWSPGLDPLTALGVSTDDPQLRQRYAELYVRQAYARTERELEFQRAVNAAWQRLYPNTPRLAGSSNKEIERYALVVTGDCLPCDEELRKTMDSMSMDPTMTADLHVVGTAGDDQLLRDWLEQRDWLKPGLRSGRFTLNHGAQFTDIKSFPAVYAKSRTGVWARER